MLKYTARRATASPAQLTFTPSNWDQIKLLHYGIADSTVDGDQTVEVHVKSSSTDAMYDELSQHKPVTVTDIAVQMSLTTQSSHSAQESSR